MKKLLENLILVWNVLVRIVVFLLQKSAYNYETLHNLALSCAFKRCHRPTLSWTITADKHQDTTKVFLCIFSITLNIRFYFTPYIISKWFISSASEVVKIKQIILRSCKELLKLTNAVWNFTSCPLEQRKLSMQSWRHQEIKTPGYNLSPFSLAGLTFLSCDLLLLLTSLINSFKYITALCFQSSRRSSRDTTLRNTVQYVD